MQKCKSFVIGFLQKEIYQVVHIELLIFFTLFFFSSGCKKDLNAKSSDASSLDNTTASKKLNVLILLSDDVGYEIPTCDGGQSYLTPNIDKLARNGRLFTQCHSSPKCSPSRQMLLTGKYNFRNYVDWGYLDPSNKTIGNMFRDARYATCYTGKWQLGGGDSSIRTFGFQRYSVWQPFNVSAKDEGNRYKGATIYQDGAYLPEQVTSNKYSEDEFTAYLLSFIDSVTALREPFFAFYSLINCHSPFQPTPDDHKYQTWDTTKSDKKFFPSMVQYHDKKIGEIISHLDSLGLLRNTLILYFGDNGTNTQISSQFNGFTVNGGKGETNEPGTNVPLIAYHKGTIPAGTVSNVLIDFTDFFPTLKEYAHILHLSGGYGKKDGISFAPALTLDIDTTRTFIYDSYSIDPAKKPFVRWTQNATYKLYDTGSGPQAGQFVRIKKEKPDSDPIPDSSLTRKQRQIKSEMLKELKKYNS